MIVYRLTSSQYQDDLSGKGAEKYGGRWNSKGIRMLYTSESRALAFAEVAMHLPIAIVPLDYQMVSIFVPDSADIETFALKNLPASWRNNPPGRETQAIGDAYVQSENALLLKLPSAVVPGDFNYLINPLHLQMKKVKVVEIVPFVFDSRIKER